RTPDASFNYTSLNLGDGSFAFEADEQSPGTMYQWFFGDNNQASTKITQHKFLSDGVFLVRLITKRLEGCANEDTASLTVFRTGLEAQKPQGILAYPNPSSGWFIIQEMNPGSKEEKTMRLYNALGVELP